MKIDKGNPFMEDSYVSFCEWPWEQNTYSITAWRNLPTQTLLASHGSLYPVGGVDGGQAGGEVGTGGGVGREL